MRHPCVNYCPWTTVFTLDDCTTLLHVDRAKLANYHNLEGLEISGRLSNLAGRDIELPNSFDLLAAKLFFELEIEVPEPILRLQPSNEGTDAFASLYDKLGGFAMFPTTHLLAQQLIHCADFYSRLKRQRVEGISTALIQLWTHIIQFCVQNELNVQSTSMQENSQDLWSPQNTRLN